MKTSDVTDTLELALQASGCDQVAVRHKPRLLPDNGASYVSVELADWLNDQGMDLACSAPLENGSCNTAIKPPKINERMNQSLR